jgi:hypothetical protein
VGGGASVASDKQGLRVGLPGRRRRGGACGGRKPQVNELPDCLKATVDARRKTA